VGMKRCWEVAQVVRRALWEREVEVQINLALYAVQVNIVKKMMFWILMLQIFVTIAHPDGSKKCLVKVFV